MFDKFFKVCLLVLLALSLVVLSKMARDLAQKDRYQVITEYEDSLGVFDTHTGELKLLDYDTGQWTVIRPMEPVGQNI